MAILKEMVDRIFPGVAEEIRLQLLVFLSKLINNCIETLSDSSSDLFSMVVFWFGEYHASELSG